MPASRALRDGSGRVGILSLQADPWSDHWQTHNAILTRLARRWPTVWVDPPHHWRAVPRRRRGGRPRFDNPLPDRPFFVYTPPTALPLVYRPGSLRRALQRGRLRQAAGRLRDEGCDRIVLYVCRPAYLPATELVGHDLLLYHIFDEYTFSADDLPNTPEEIALIRRADRVIIHSPGLLEKKGEIAPERTVFVPNGVDFAAFSAPVAEPEELKRVPRPRIGYTGVLKRHLDWPLIRELAERHPEWHWVFVGHWSRAHPELREVRAWAAQQRNFHHVPEVPASRLGAFPQHFDVSVMPYVRNGYTKHIYPLKLHEYLAAGRPVVGTPIRTLRDFAHVVGLAGTAEEWSVALAAALSPGANTPAAVEARRAVARAHDWDLLAGRVAEVIEQGLAEREARRA